MSESEAEKCPKCGGGMAEGKRLVGYVKISLAKKGDIFGDNIFPFYCKNCGYIELHKEMERKKK
ncbi:hypothetical protein KAU92_05600 [Candidatus Bathyarchaeota archaeon]|nr:hypothetical protein [Candidatus Bathyarchaeota archaeon]MCK4669020.1 hypothetical protein [Candidatus Bathyarchaeota archaeon]